MKKDEIKLDKLYNSTKVKFQPKLEYSKNSKGRPSWIKTRLNKETIFLKVLFNDEVFWYRRYFKDYFFPLNSTSDDYKNYYNKIAKEYDSFVPQQKEISIKLISLLEELKIDRKNKILDLGAGTGIVTEDISNIGYENITLLDISEKELEIAKKRRSLKNAKFVISDLAKERINGKYDLIYETMSLDYFKDEEINSILQKIKTSLKDEGRFIIIDRHIPHKVDNFFGEIKRGKFQLNTPSGKFDYYYYVGIPKR